jgi:hypothetical protein
MHRIRCYRSVKNAGSKVEDLPVGGDEIPPWRGKKCDKLIDPTVRVILRRNY